MKRFYQRLAIINLKSNRQFYLPYLLVGMFSAMLFYSIRAIQRNEGVAKMRGADILSIVLAMGTVIIGICVCIFLFYTNSFVMKRRRKELGMFNVAHYMGSVLGGAIFVCGICRRRTCDRDCVQQASYYVFISTDRNSREYTILYIRCRMLTDSTAFWSDVCHFARV